MSTFTAVAFEHFLEHRVEKSGKSGVLAEENDRNDLIRDFNAEGGASKHLFISPALYVTPVQAPVPQLYSADQPSPFPYVVNHKRRGGGNERKRIDRSEVQYFPSEGEGRDLYKEEEVGDNFVNEFAGYDDEKGDDEGAESQIFQAAKEDMYNNGGRQGESRSFISAQGEFFDANDDFSSEGSFSNIPSCESKIELELNDTRLMLLQEIERKKNVEENLLLICNQWNQICALMQQAGLTFPQPHCGRIQPDNLWIDQFCQEMFVSRYVLEEIGRGQAHAEAEEEAGAVIESKDQEISRLQDRLHYYETVNHEMSQRKFVEIARKRQERKRDNRRWFWGFMGLSITIGVSLAAYSYIPESSQYLQFLKSGNSIDVSCIDPSEN